MKKIVHLVLFPSLFTLLLSCSSGYVDSEPTYVEVTRPVSPAPNYVWVNDNYVWRRNNYVHQSGYWVEPRPNRVYVEGRWKKEPRGYRWQKGRWK